LEALLADLITNQPLYSAQANTLAGALRHWHPQRRSLSEGEILRAEIRVLSRKLAEAGAQADTGVFATSQRYGGYSGWSSGYGNTGTTLSESSSARLREALELAFANTPATETNNLLRTCIDRAREGLPLFEAERQMAVQAVLALRSTLLEDRETNAEQLGELKELLSALGKGVVRTTVETTDNLDEVAEDLDLALAEEPAHSEVTDAPVL
jgi:hypothetical protein